MKQIFSTVLFQIGVLMPVLITAKQSKLSKNGDAWGSLGEVVFTLSPIYAATPTSVDLKSGEVINHPSIFKYSTIDEELLAQLDDQESKNKPQKRFHPPANFKLILPHTNNLKQQTATTNLINPVSNKNIVYTNPISSMVYDYAMNADTKFKPMTNKSSEYSDPSLVFSPSKFSDTHYSVLNNNPSIQESEYDKPTSFIFNRPSKSVEFLEDYDHIFINSPSYKKHRYHDEIIYDHIPNDQYLQHQPDQLNIQEPELMDQRVNKKPYSYYFIGKKLWYIPLYFSIYFIIYIAALVLKSIARHKINFPTNMVVVGDNARSSSLVNKNSPGWINYVTKVLESIEKYRKVS